MARVQRYKLDDPDIDLSPAIAPDPLDLRVSLADDHPLGRQSHLAADRHGRCRLPRERRVDVPRRQPAFSYRGAMRPANWRRPWAQDGRTSMLAHRLDEAGLIVRVREPSDERSTLLALIPRGRRSESGSCCRPSSMSTRCSPTESEEDTTTLKRLLSPSARDAMWMQQAPRKRIEPGRPVTCGGGHADLPVGGRPAGGAPAEEPSPGDRRATECASGTLEIWSVRSPGDSFYRVRRLPGGHVRVTGCGSSPRTPYGSATRSGCGTMGTNASGRLPRHHQARRRCRGHRVLASQRALPPPPREEAVTVAVRARGAGRPTKRERRSIDKLLGRPVAEGQPRQAHPE